jgi:hypothetical protein
MLFMRHVFDPHRPIEVKRMAVKLVAREGSKDAKANSKGEGGVGPSGKFGAMSPSSFLPAFSLAGKPTVIKVQ